MNGHGALGVQDDRIKQAAQRILRQYHLEKSDQSEDSAAPIAPDGSAAGAPDSIQALRLAVDDMNVRIEHMQRLMANREDLFMAALERIERNQAKADGSLDALSMEVARIDSRPTIDVDAILKDRQAETLALMQEFGGMMSLGRALLDEVRDVHAASLALSEQTKDAAGLR